MSEPALSSRRALAVGLVVAVSAFAFDNLAIATAMPEITRRLGGVALYGAAFSAFGLAMLLSLAVAGPLADRFGPRSVLTVGLTLFSVGLVLGGLAPSMGVVVVARAVQGLGGGTIGACAYVAIGRMWAPDERGRVLAVLSGAWVLPSLIAPAIAGVVADQVSWRLVFLGLIPFPIVAALLVLPALGRLGPAAGATADGSLWRRARLAVRLAAGTGLVLAAISLRSLAIAAALVLLGAVVAVPALHRLLPPGTLSARPVLPAIVAVRFMLTWSFFGADAFVPFAVTKVRGGDVVLAGLALSTAGLAWSAAAWVQARPQAPPIRTALLLGFACIATGTSMVAAVAADDSIPVGLTFLGWAVAGAGMGFAFNSTSVAALGQAAPGQEGVTTSSLHLAESLGGAMATGLGGTIVAVGERSGWRLSSTAVAVFVLAMAGTVPGALAAGRLGAGTDTLTRPAAAR